MPIVDDIAGLRRILARSRTLAVVGLSANYPDLKSIPENVDVVDCFRKAEEMVPLARDAVAIGAKVLWMQLGIRNDEAARIALDVGLDVVMDHCVKIEHARILGGLNWAGVNTGVISARRATA